jgi:hypothetical protein
MSTNSTWIYKNQELSITLDAGRDITGTTITYLVKDPYGYTTDTPTTFVSSTAGTVIHTFSTGYFNKAGQWTIKINEEGTQTPGHNYYLYIRERWES